MSVDAAIWARVDAVLNSGCTVGLAVTGGGIEACSWLVNHPGASRAVVEVQVPYHMEALRDYLGNPGPHRVTEETARSMAVRAYWRARGFSNGVATVGVGCSAALATLRNRRGVDHAHIVLRGDVGYDFFHVVFDSPGEQRTAQEAILSHQIIEALALTCGLGHCSRSADGIACTNRREYVHEPLEQLLRGVSEKCYVGSSEGMSPREGPNCLLFPGSFNPLHEGHVALLEAGRARSTLPLQMELSAANVDKPNLSYSDVRRRLSSIGGRFPIVVTRAATFAEKARLFPRCIFLVGYDTAVRVLDASYYASGEIGMVAALEEISTARCSFLVGGRFWQGQFRSLDDLVVPPSFSSLFESIPKAEFRYDISSSEIRAASE